MKNTKTFLLKMPVGNKGVLFSDFSISTGWELWFDAATPEQKYTVHHLFSICVAERDGVKNLRIILLWFQWIISFVSQPPRTEPLQ